MSYSQFTNQWRLRRSAQSPAAFLYETGGQGIGLDGMTFTRASAALQLDASGIWQSAATNVIRSSHYQSGVITTLREGAGTNSALGSCLFADDTYWVGSASFTIAAATSFISGQSAWKHTDAAGGAVRTANRGTFVSGQTDCEWFGLEDTADGNVASDITIYDATVGGALYTARVTWATNTIATTAGTGTCGIINDGNGRYRCYVAAAGVAAGAVAGGAGNTRQLRIAPVITAGKSCIIHIGELEAASAVPSSPIVTVAAAVTRAADLWSFPWSRVPEAGTWYVDAYNLKGDAAAVVLYVGAGANTVAYERLYTFSGAFIGAIGMAAGTSTSATAATAYGDRVENRMVLSVSGADGAAILGQSVNSAAETVGATGTTRAMDAAWSAPARLYIGMRGDTGTPANLAIRSIAYVAQANYPLSAFRALVGG